MNTQHLRYVVEIDRMRSISQAAERLYVSQPNLSRVLRDLEADLGFHIFERSSQGVRPTREGAAFLQHARAMLREEDSIRALGEHQAGEDRLRVCLPRDAELFDLTVAYLNALDVGLGLNVSIRECHASQALTQLGGREAEVGILRFRAEFLKYFQDQTALRDLNLRLLRTFRYVVTLSGDHPLAGRDRLDGEALRDCPEVLHGDALHRAYGGQRRVYTVDRLAQVTLLKGMPGAYMRSAPLPEGMAAALGLVQIPSDDLGGEYADALVTHSRYPLSDTAQGFASYVMERLENL